MLRPSHFDYNIETAGSNSFQHENLEDGSSLQQKVLREFDAFVAVLRKNGVNVLLINDSNSPPKPDAIFPNNWISIHHNGTLIIYPMMASNRRFEKRKDIIEQLEAEFDIKEIIDLSAYEKENTFLEGTGSIVFDHNHKTAYACISPRTNLLLLKRVCQLLSYQAFSFHAVDGNDEAIYHTNVMMCIGNGFALICVESIQNNIEKKELLNSLRSNGQQVIELAVEQMNQFAGNMLLLKNSDQKELLILSQSAYNSLNSIQKEKLRKYATLVPVSINTIEQIGGGSARCMMAEVFAKKNSN